MNMNKIPIGISSCLLGQPVRYDGGHKLDSYITGTLAQYFDLIPFCPEVAIGMGTPRPTIQLVKTGDGIRSLGVKNADMDVTESLQGYADRQKQAHGSLCGYILKKDSPSCGMERVKVYSNNQPQKIGIGIYAEIMMRNHPLLPVEEEGRLGDPRLRENFIQRVYVLHRWKQLLAEGLSPSRLTRFHARHKLIVMSHDSTIELGQLLASVTKSNVGDVAQTYIAQLMKTLKKVASRKSHVNVLQHIQGYLKKELEADDKAELYELIERYRQGEVPLIVPLTLIKHHFRKNPDPYSEDSYYMSPYPQALQLINSL
ncbi:hypothetical protein MGMO_146c00020 [Methyloglobulus morosus KoM1]|uniref:DUF1722 domain-containing protein n=2 Tax=Methyloglobulus TaxID=1410680 RepID=V5BV84_9GAMM|nr:hypothetical protein MGMO_146c00020 [Methyloglobulus morosus KoM1]